MHVPGVKSEQPSRRPPLEEPVAIDMTIRDRNHVRIVRVDDKRPEDCVRILNSILQKLNSEKRVVMIERGGLSDSMQDEPTTTPRSTDSTREDENVRMAGA